ncbi:hypothetical protein ACD591_03560 [Rufibacter glacialis]|uniref:Uncharacterized protein n=1 Tax=Rufibacter glacialis TaxID=1259555 RepID=A0ABV4RB63_9BACT|nr:hypothetical protein [Rufibacter glacialis]
MQRAVLGSLLEAVKPRELHKASTKKQAPKAIFQNDEILKIISALLSEKARQKQALLSF